MYLAHARLVCDNRSMSLKGVAKETLSILEAGGYEGPAGWVALAEAQAAAEAGTRLYRPEALAALLERQGPGGAAPRVSLSAESTQQAAQRMAAEGSVVLLDFASARNPGGGFLRGARAQEEDISRCSGLYPCQLRAPDYYAVNRAERDLVYTDHMIYSPAVPFFRVESRALLEQAFVASVITAPAPNAGEVLRRDPSARPRIHEALRRRAGMLLALAREEGHRRLLLGAWGCGVFRNEPAQVANTFLEWLRGPTFAGDFDEAAFAIYDRSKSQSVIEAFRRLIEG